MGLVLESECDCNGRDVCVRAGTRFERLIKSISWPHPTCQRSCAMQWRLWLCPTHCVVWECVLGRTLLVMGNHSQIRQQFHTAHASSPLPPSMFFSFLSLVNCLGPTRGSAVGAPNNGAGDEECHASSGGGAYADLDAEYDVCCMHSRMKCTNIAASACHAALWWCMTELVRVHVFACRGTNTVSGPAWATHFCTHANRVSHICKHSHSHLDIVLLLAFVFLSLSPFPFREQAETLAYLHVTPCRLENFEVPTFERIADVEVERVETKETVRVGDVLAGEKPVVVCFLRKYVPLPQLLSHTLLCFVAHVTHTHTHTHTHTTQT